MNIAQYGTTIVRWFCGFTDAASARSLKSLPKDSARLSPLLTRLRRRGKGQ